ncbi:DUF4625 domain-containing protein [Robertkochia solimangrovi]|uniref:DUF4625 domain-containing protein n=1 Tax=Robertkochia solimangrovi TaxID=2213046 RepID=UPI0011810F4F|nr:DUF4625 domain-containing protein [Robertkochia solimangrovi]TRZ42864.1 hypothetical protein DMZ48_12405 [Robertkochia solimangrovi]
MKRIQYFIVSIIGMMLLACSGDDSVIKDEEKPTISLNYIDGFPQTCSVLKRGSSYDFRALVTDNFELASYSIDIHHNFDHHTHDDQGVNCELEAVKTAVNPLIYMENYMIEGGVDEYEIIVTVEIPEDVDTGDYHCQYSVTDKTGWQGRTSIDIKIVE